MIYVDQYKTPEVLLENVSMYNNFISSSNAAVGSLIYGRSGFKLNISNLKGYNNIINIKGEIAGGFINIGASGQSSKLNISNSEFYNNSFISDSIFGGLIYSGGNSINYISNIKYYDNNIINVGYTQGSIIQIGQSSKLNISNSEFYNNSFISDNIFGGLINSGSDSINYISNIKYYDNIINVGYIEGSIIKTGSDSNVEISNLKSYNNSIISSDVINGGFIVVYPYSKFSISNVELYNNSLNSTGDIRGGGIYLYQTAQGTIDNFKFYDNSFNCTNYMLGGGVYGALRGDLNLNNSMVFNNKVCAPLECRGLSFYITTPTTSPYTVNLTDFKVFDNSIYANFTSGAIILSFGVSNIENGTINNNQVFANDTYPGTWIQPSRANTGMVYLQGSGKLNNISFDDNYLSSGLGVALQLAPVNSTYLVENCNFTNNLCGAALKDSDRTFFMDHGGAICINGNQGGSVILRSCLFESNVNSQGGAITPHGNAIIENCRFCDQVLWWSYKY